MGYGNRNSCIYANNQGKFRIASRRTRKIGYNDKYPLKDINQLFTECPTEIAIYVHGWDNDHYKAKERLDRVKMSLENNSCYIPLIGLRWDSKTDWDPAKSIAKENGPKLAQFILDYKETCKYEQNKDVKEDYLPIQWDLG